MVIYWSILIWTSIWGLISNKYSRIVKTDNGQTRQATKVLAFTTIFAVVFFAGLRSSVADTHAYIRFYNEIPVSLSALRVFILNAKDVGFALYASLFKQFFSEYYLWFLVTAVISGIGTVVTVRKYSLNFGFSMFLFIGTCQFLWMFNGIRQYLVAAVLFGSIDLMVKGKPIKYFALVIGLSFIHNTALIMIPAYFIVREKAWGIRAVGFIAFSSFVIFFPGQFISLLDTLMTGTSYEGDLYYFTNDDGTNVIRVLVASVPTIISLVFIKRVRRIKDGVTNILINLSVVSSGLYIISSVTSGILIGRLPLYFEMANLILLPNLIEKIFNKRSRVLIYSFAIILYFAYFYFQFVVVWNGVDYSSDLLGISTR